MVKHCCWYPTGIESHGWWFGFCVLKYLKTKNPDNRHCCEGRSSVEESTPKRKKIMTQQRRTKNKVMSVFTISGKLDKTLKGFQDT